MNAKLKIKPIQHSGYSEDHKFGTTVRHADLQSGDKIDQGILLHGFMRGATI